MALEATFQELPPKLMHLRTDLKDLEVFIGDKPQAHKLPDDLGEIVVDLWNRVDQALEAALEAQAAVQHPTDLGRARSALATCQEQFNFVSHRLLTELRSDRQMAELNRLGRRLGGEWRGWASSVRQTLEESHLPLYEVNQALFRCWQELTERLDTMSVSVQATNIGQQITAPEERAVNEESLP
ncbi:MAG: hypothetical protein BroJett011_75410 [Chloroflexota bacterium]|nr:MAG: hypothetical protein BroJett011_75410 [Chloroflexota bacterium]